MYLLEDELRGILRTLGANWYETHLPEVLMLCNLLQENEVVNGIIFGKYKHFLEGVNGRGALVATNFRILLIDRKPLYLRYEELPYNMISGFNYASSGAASTVNLKTRVGDITIRSWNRRSVGLFIRAIDKYIISTSGTASYIYN